MAYDQAVLDKVAANTPRGSQRADYAVQRPGLRPAEHAGGKESLRKSVLDSINRVVKLKGDGVVQDVFSPAL